MFKNGKELPLTDKPDRANFDSFPVLSPGGNAISWSGGTVTKVEIVPHWRRL